MKIHVNGTLDSILINKVNPDSISNTADIHLHGHVLWDRPNTRQILENLESEAKKKRKRTYVLVVNDDESPYPNHEWNQTIAIAQSNTELADRIANFQNLETAQRICATVFHKYMKYHPINTLIEYAETYTD